MNRQEMIEMSEKFLAAWNEQDVEKVAGCYAPDLQYIDPNTKGQITDGASFRRYLKKLFAAWEMHWSLREAYPFKDGEGGVVLWHAKIARPGRAEAIEIDGMDLVLFEDGLVRRNDVYFDRAALSPLM